MKNPPGFPVALGIGSACMVVANAKAIGLDGKHGNGSFVIDGNILKGNDYRQIPGAEIPECFPILETCFNNKETM